MECIHQNQFERAAKDSSIDIKNLQRKLVDQTVCKLAGLGGVLNFKCYALILMIFNTKKHCMI